MSKSIVKSSHISNDDHKVQDFLQNQNKNIRFREPNIIQNYQEVITGTGERKVIHVERIECD